MRVSDFDYRLPQELIAQEPLSDRSASRMLRLPPGASGWEDRKFSELPDLLRPGDLLVLNNTRVFPARLLGRRSGRRALRLSPHNPASRDFLRGRVEVLLTRQLSEDPQVWEALVRPGRKIGVGEQLYFGNDELQAEVVAHGEYGERRLRFAPVSDFFDTIDRLGHIPLPPYMGREDRPEDRQRYQTVYANVRGSVAAPTAGLHFTPEVLERLRSRGIEITEITLHVGLGTFQPVHTEAVEDHRLHRERYCISDLTADRINRARAEGRRIVAVGTTTVRTLEYAGSLGDREIAPGEGEADIFIYPGYRFRVIDALLTNFHLPQSTLLMLVCALAGRERMLSAYEHAIRERYRFYSYGDCMLIE